MSCTNDGHTSVLRTVGIVVMVLGVLAPMVTLMRSGPRRQGVTPGRADTSHSGLTADPIDPNL